MVGVVGVLLVLAYAMWRRRKAGEVRAREAAAEDSIRYFEAMKGDPRWLALQRYIRQRYPITFDADCDSGVFRVDRIGLVCDQGFMYRPDNALGPARVAALLVRKNPTTSICVSMHLTTGELREDPAPNGWTYVGPPR